MPMVTIKHVANPIIIEAKAIFTSTNAKLIQLIPTAIASILVPIAVRMVINIDWLFILPSSFSSSFSVGLKDLNIVKVPNNDNMPNANQWSQDTMNEEDNLPNPHPNIGVIASMIPNIIPVFNAIDIFGFLKLTPFAIAAAKASVDIAKERKISASRFIPITLWLGN